MRSVFNTFVILLFYDNNKCLGSGCFIIFKMFKRKPNKGNELAKQRAKNELHNQNLILGNGIINPSFQECSKCGDKFSEFDLGFVEAIGNYYQCCPNCKANITDTVFYPLNIKRNRIE